MELVSGQGNRRRLESRPAATCLGHRQLRAQRVSTCLSALAFGWVEGAKPYQSLLLGQHGGTWYNRFPMPYRRQAIVRIDTEKPLKGTMRVWTIGRGLRRRRLLSRGLSPGERRPAPGKTLAGSRKRAMGITRASSS